MTEKAFIGKTPRTRVSITDEGRERIEEHWRQLEALRADAASWQPAPTEASTDAYLDRHRRCGIDAGLVRATHRNCN